jgi:hypothetical protein
MLVADPGGGADCGIVMFCVNLPLESAFALPTVVLWTRSSTVSPGAKPLPLTVTVAPRGARAGERLISGRAAGAGVVGVFAVFGGVVGVVGGVVGVVGGVVGVVGGVVGVGGVVVGVVAGAVGAAAGVG